MIIALSSIYPDSAVNLHVAGAEVWLDYLTAAWMHGVSAVRNWLHSLASSEPNPPSLKTLEGPVRSQTEATDSLRSSGARVNNGSLQPGMADRAASTPESAPFHLICIFTIWQRHPEHWIGASS
ncbi:unnamed protein product [Natator depressus]